MGAVVFGIPQGLTLKLRDLSGARVLIETGTFYGDTALWGAEHFDSVYTIEHDRDRYLAALMRLNDKPNVHVYHGDSREKLESVLAHLPGKAIFWLDAHWCAEGPCDTTCPLLDELELVLGRNSGDIILIDDARFFEEPPPLPENCPAYWPNMHQILNLIAHAPSFRSVQVIDDVIVVFPNDLFRTAFL